MYTTPWSDDEIDILTANWAGHGRDWAGWEMLLPGRTPKAIQRKANGMGMVEPRDKPRRKPKQPKHKEPRMTTAKPKLVPDPYEGYVMRCMEEGMTPKQIDRHMHWFPGSASLIMLNRWKRERGAE